MMHEILVISNSVVRESALPDFAPATQNRPEGVRVPAFDELNRMLERHTVRRCKEKMYMLGHEHKCMNEEASLASVSKHGYEEKPDVIFDDEESAPLPCRERYEVSPGRGDESSRLQE